MFQVHNLIERCLWSLMSKEEAVNALLLQAKIHPNFTKIGNIILLMCLDLCVFIFLWVIDAPHLHAHMHFFILIYLAKLLKI